MVIILFILAAYMLLSGFAAIYSIGKKREPTTPGLALTSVITALIYVVVLVIAALHYLGQ